MTMMNIKGQVYYSLRRMKVISSFWWILIVSTLSRAGGSKPPPSWVIENVSVIDPLDQVLLMNRYVWIQGETIEAIESDLGGLNITLLEGEDVKFLDGSNQYLLPGLWDMHTHLLYQSSFDRGPLAGLFIANGVFNIREMAGDCMPPCSRYYQIDGSRRFQSHLESGAIVGPHIRAIGSFQVNGPTDNMGFLSLFTPDWFYPGTEEEGRRLVRYMDERGVDFIKMYNSITREAFFAMKEEAEILQLDVSGHNTRAISSQEASFFRTMEHARFPAYACADTSEAYRERMSQVAEGEADNLNTTELFEFLKSFITQHNETLCQQVMQSWKDNNLFYDPTHRTREWDFGNVDPEFLDDERKKYMPFPVRAGWNGDKSEGLTDEQIDIYRQFYEFGLELTGRMKEFGVKVMIGTDAFDSYVFPGFSVHDEMAMLVESAAAFTPMEVLRAATVLPSEYFGLEDQYGSVRVGYRADLLLLNNNPLDNIRHSTSIDQVFFNGRHFSREELDDLLTKAEAHANRSILSAFFYVWDLIPGPLQFIFPLFGIV